MAKNILICDDAAFMRMMIKDILTKNGYNVAGEAENGAKGVEKYNELKPDLVLMDITMPEMDGIEALKAIKASDAGQTSHFRVMSMKSAIHSTATDDLNGFSLKSFNLVPTLCIITSESITYF